MSLIDEALKRARLDAARQEAAKQSALKTDGPYLWAPLPEKAASSSRTLLLGLAAGGIGALLVGGLLFVALRRPSIPVPSPAPRTAEVAALAPAPAASDGGDEAAAPAKPRKDAKRVDEAAPPAVKLAARSTASEKQPTARREERKPSPAATAEESAPAAAAAPRSETAADPSPVAAVPVPLRTPPPPAAAPAPAPADGAPAAGVAVAPSPAPAKGAEAPAASLEDGKTYVREAPIGGGALKLSGIAYSETQPIAVINGRVMAPGEAIEGFTVSKIQAQRVELHGHGVTVYLALQ